MITIYAESFMTATRVGTIRLRDVPSVSDQQRHRWFTRRRVRDIDPKDL